MEILGVGLLNPKLLQTGLMRINLAFYGVTVIVDIPPRYQNQISTDCLIAGAGKSVLASVMYLHLEFR